MPKKRPETHAPLSELFAPDEAIDGLFAVTRDAAPDLSDMDHFHRAIAADDLAAVLTQLALFDPELSETRH
jgi:hypothetical protein